MSARIDVGEIEMTGNDGLIPQLIKASLERGLPAELSGHLGCEKGAISLTAIAVAWVLIVATLFVLPGIGAP